MNVCLRIISNVLSYTVSHHNHGSTLLNNQAVFIDYFILIVDGYGGGTSQRNPRYMLKSSNRTIVKEVAHFSQVMDEAKDYGCQEESLKLEQALILTIQTFRNYLIL